MGEKIKVSDAIVSELKKNGIDTVFGVTGGAVVHFFDSISRQDGIRSVFVNHEQSAAFAAQAYARARRGLGAAIVTTGPGATNALTGVAAAWLDSVPCVFISGQVRSNQTIRGRNLRQVGTQEIDIVSMVKPITKYAVTVYEANEVIYHLQKAIAIAQSGRSGPVWIDIPVDISWTYLERDCLKQFDSSQETDFFKPHPDHSQIEQVIDLLKASRRPLVVAGFGARLANCELELREWIERHQIPFVSTWSFCDWIESDHPLNLGRPGLSGQRGANLAMQNSDLIIAIGTHLNATIVGTRPELFAREAQIVMVDIDQNELDCSSVGVDVAVNCDAKQFLEEIQKTAGNELLWENDSSEWLTYCQKYQELNRIALDFENNNHQVNSYFFNFCLSQVSVSGDNYVVDGGGTVVYSAYQSIEIKQNQRLILSTGLCSMGSGIPEAIGVQAAFPDRRIFCLVGDGSFPFNMQELAVIRNNNLPIKIFVFNNSGYASIRTTQNDFLEGRIVGSSSDSGLSLLDVEKVSNSFGLPFYRFENQSNLTGAVEKIIAEDGPFICEILVSPSQEIVPRQGFLPREDGTFEPRPIEDMYPFLSRSKFDSLMVVPEVKESTTKKEIGQELNLMRSYPQASRPIEQRAKVKRGQTFGDEYGTAINSRLFEELIGNSRKFDKYYFDGDRSSGYGGYHYNKKYWQGVAKDLVEHYGLKDKDRVLEVGCAKGFLLHDLQQLVPGLEVHGLDISEYAVTNCLLSVKDRISVGKAQSLPFADRSFDLVLAINTLSELSLGDCKTALREIDRVSCGKSFVTLNSWRNEREKRRLLKWNLTALSNLSVNAWKDLFCEIGYRGDYYWFFAR